MPLELAEGDTRKGARKALLRRIALDQKAAAKAKLATLKRQVRETRASRRRLLREARVRCRARKGELVAQKKREREAALARLRAEAKARRDDVLVTCAADREAYGTGPRSILARERAELAAERTYQRDLKRIEAGNRASLRSLTRATRKEIEDESDDEVRQNLDPALVPLFNRVRKQIKGTARRSRTESFLHYVEEHPRELEKLLEESTDREIAELERRMAAPAGELETGEDPDLEWPPESGRRRTGRRARREGRARERTRRARALPSPGELRAELRRLCTFLHDGKCRPPRLRLKHVARPPEWAGWAYYDTRTIELRVWPGMTTCEAHETLLHELCHLALGAAEGGHTPRHRALCDRVRTRAYGASSERAHEARCGLSDSSRTLNGRPVLSGEGAIEMARKKSRHPRKKHGKHRKWRGMGKRAFFAWLGRKGARARKRHGRHRR